jgi:hypothetical protein
MSSPLISDCNSSPAALDVNAPSVREVPLVTTR